MKTKKRVRHAVAENTQAASPGSLFKASSTAKPGRRQMNRPPVIAVNQQVANNQTEGTLRQPHAFIASMIEHLPNMVFVKDAEDLRFIHLNEAGEKLLGYSRFEFLGKNDYDFFPKEEAEFFTAMDREVLASGRLLDIPEETIQTRHNGTRLLHTKKIPIFDADGTRQYLLGISEDITERKEAEHALRNANSELERRVIERTAQLLEVNAALQREIAERQAAVESLRSLSARLINAREEESSRIAREIHDDFSQQLALIGMELEQIGQQPPSSGLQLSARCHELWKKIRELSADLHGLSHELHPSKLDHLGVVAAVRSFCSEITQRHNVSVECLCHDVPEFLPKTVALSLYRVVQEALQNVVKHSGARDAKVEISGCPDIVSVSISDFGAGFDPDCRPEKGGLGLTSMRERVRLIGGELSIRSSPSQGTRVNVRVPLTTPASSS